MKKKLLSIILLMIILLSVCIISNIYADNNELVSIPNKNVEAGKRARVYLNLENINEYIIDKIVLSTNIYIEAILDTSDTNLTEDDIKYDAQNKEFTIVNISEEIKTLCVEYIIPKYISNGTKIELTVTAFGYTNMEELGQIYNKAYVFEVIGDEEQTSIKGNDNDFERK